MGAQIGVEVPLKTNKHAYVVSDIVPGLKDEKLPNVRYFDEAIYLKVCMSLCMRKMNGFTTYMTCLETSATTCSEEYA